MSPSPDTCRREVLLCLAASPKPLSTHEIADRTTLSRADVADAVHKLYQLTVIRGVTAETRWENALRVGWELEESALGILYVLADGERRKDQDIHEAVTVRRETRR